MREREGGGGAGTIERRRGGAGWGGGQRKKEGAFGLRWEEFSKVWDERKRPAGSVCVCVCALCHLCERISLYLCVCVSGCVYACVCVFVCVPGLQGQAKSLTVRQMLWLLYGLLNKCGTNSSPGTTMEKNTVPSLNKHYAASSPPRKNTRGAGPPSTGCTFPLSVWSFSSSSSSPPPKKISLSASFHPFPIETLKIFPQTVFAQIDTVDTDRYALLTSHCPLSWLHPSFCADMSLAITSSGDSV